MSFAGFPIDNKENDEKPGSSKTLDLKKENKYLRTQLEAATREKELETAKHIQERKQWENDLRELQNRLVFERKNFKNDIMEITAQLDSLKKSVDRMIQARYQSKPFEHIHKCDYNIKTEPQLSKNQNEHTKSGVFSINFNKY
jgi:hypothetical protein